MTVKIKIVDMLDKVQQKPELKAALSLIQKDIPWDEIAQMKPLYDLLNKEIEVESELLF